MSLCGVARPRVALPVPVTRRQSQHARAVPADSAAALDTALETAVLDACATCRKAGAGPRERTAALEAVAALEAQATVPAPDSAEGTWALVWSVQEASPGPAGSLAIDGAVQAAVQQATDTLYGNFFKFFPALAGAQGGEFRGVRNEQTVSLAKGTVSNTVWIQPPALAPASSPPLVVTVRGEAGVGDAATAELDVVFTSFSLALGEAEGAPKVELPLPRPRGNLRTTVCTERGLRVSRGGRGGVFVLKRL
mmetsp:Transcript_8410/g.27936  ORF Transcript_8410/g.27936 Transcript_8410/m.27936 type:complete len:251 (-) Transcript_8410:644-1396(-)